MDMNGKRWRHEHHLCVNCKKQDAFTLMGRWRCADCQQRENERQKKKRESDNDNAEKQAAKKYRETHKAKGLCKSCSRPATPGYVTCQICRAKGRKARKAWRDAQRPEGYITRWDACPRCGGELPDGEKLCPECKEKLVRRLAHERTEAESAAWRESNKAFFARI